VRRRDLTGAQFLLKYCDEKLIDEDLNEEGSAFAEGYYEQTYLTDYCSVLLPYEDPDTWSNFDRIAPILDQRFKDWRATRE
jgi:hypothetical protein